MGGTCRRCRRTVDPTGAHQKPITRDYIISLEDAKQYRTLKRHLGLMGLPAQYHAKWLLPADCPMVAAACSVRRSELAKQLGLGRKPGTVVPKAAKRAQQK